MPVPSDLSLLYTRRNSRRERELEDDYDEDAETAYPLAAKVAMERNVRCVMAYM